MSSEPRLSSSIPATLPCLQRFDCWALHLSARIGPAPPHHLVDLSAPSAMQVFACSYSYVFTLTIPVRFVLT